jgi:hypothetical protein
MKINEEKLREIISDVILEYAGVSDEVMSISRRIVGSALEYLNGGRYGSVDVWKRRCLGFGIEQMYPGGDVNQMPLTDVDLRDYRQIFWVEDIEDLDDMISSVFVCAYGYNLLDVEKENYAVAFLANYIQSRGEHFCYYKPDTRSIVLNLPCGIDPRDGSAHIGSTVLSTINHEVKHAFQYYKRGGDGIIDKSYHVSSYSTAGDSNIIDNLGLSVGQIKYAYYAFDFDEVDAVLQQIYIEITEKNCELERSWSYMNITMAKEIYNKIYSFYNSSRYKYPIRDLFNKIYGSDFIDKYLVHCQRGIKRFDEHLRRIIGRISSERPGQRILPGRGA